MILFTDYPRALDDLVNDCYEIAASKGFHDDELPAEFDIPRKLALIHTEVSEALDVQRHPYDDANEDPVTGMTPLQEADFLEEIADVVIRCFDLVGAYDFDSLGEVLIAKMEKNRNRPHRHNRRF